jgi:hypothetical protein
LERGVLASFVLLSLRLAQVHFSCISLLKHYYQKHLLQRTWFSCPFLTAIAGISHLLSQESGSPRAKEEMSHHITDVSMTAPGGHEAWNILNSGEGLNTGNKKVNQ